MDVLNIFKTEDSPIIFERSAPIFKPQTPKNTAAKGDNRSDITKTYSNGVVFKKETTHPCEWTKYTKEGDLSLEDIECITVQKLKINLAIILKPAWASGATVGEMVKVNRGKWLYGKRNLEKYWAIFNRNNPSPN